MSGTLAQTIMGEAGSNPRNQFAVASTIFNRQQAGTFPGGSSLSGIVNAPLQFVGSNPNPNSSAQRFADALQSGTLGNFGDTGNAVNFQSGATAAKNGFTNGGANIGGNFFSDRFGAPTSGFVAPSFGGGSPGGGDGNNIVANSNDPNSGMFDGNSGVGAFGPGGAPDGTSTTGMGSFAPGGDPAASNPGGDFVTMNPDSGNPSGVIGDPTQIFGGVGSGNGSGSGGGVTTGTPGSSNVPGAQALTDGVTGVVNVTGEWSKKGAEAVSKASDAVTNGISGAASTIAAAGSSWLDSLEKTGTSWLTRAGVMMLAIVLLLGAILIIAMSGKSQPQIVPVPI